MDENFNYIPIRNNSTLKESFKLPLEKILVLKDNDFFKVFEETSKLVKKNIPNFDDRYNVAGATNLRINGTSYPFPVLTTKEHTNQFFPELINSAEIQTLNYHILLFEKIPKKNIISLFFSSQF